LSVDGVPCGIYELWVECIVSLQIFAALNSTIFLDNRTIKRKTRLCSCRLLQNMVLN